jgi:hypothetical protein
VFLTLRLPDCLYRMNCTDKFQFSCLHNAIYTVRYVRSNSISDLHAPSPHGHNLLLASIVYGFSTALFENKVNLYSIMHSFHKICTNRRADASNDIFEVIYELIMHSDNPLEFHMRDASLRNLKSALQFLIFIRNHFGFGCTVSLLS